MASLAHRPVRIYKSERKLREFATWSFEVSKSMAGLSFSHYLHNVPDICFIYNVKDFYLYLVGKYIYFILVCNQSVRFWNFISLT